VRSLSKGQRRRLQLLLALAPRPPLLILDEPTEGLDPVAREDLRGVLAEHMADTGCTIILSTHQVADVEGLADHIGVLKHGKLLAQVPRDSLRERMRIYSADGPPGWTSPADLPGLVLHSQKRGREASLTVFGEVSEVIAGVARSGGVVRDVATMSLDQAVVALLRIKEAA